MLIPLKPFGIHMGSLRWGRPLLLLKDDSGQWLMPVPVQTIDVAHFMHQSGRASRWESPYIITQKILQVAGLTPAQVILDDVKDYSVMGRLEWHQGGHITAKAEHLLGLAMHLSLPIYSTAETIQKARQLGSWLQDFQISNDVIRMLGWERPHEYLI